jgi:hypothetical protein
VGRRGRDHAARDRLEDFANRSTARITGEARAGIAGLASVLSTKNESGLSNENTPGTRGSQ